MFDRDLRTALAAATLLLLTGEAVVATTPARASSTAAAAMYIVELDERPAASYTGDRTGLGRTAPAPGERFDSASAASRSYRAHLGGRRAAVLRAAGLAAGAALYSYTTALNGFAARLNTAEVASLRRTSGVRRVWPSGFVRRATVSTPRMLDLDGEGGVWQNRFGSSARAGEGMIIGVLDSGIVPEHPSFAALPEPRPDKKIIDRKWHGSCDSGVEGRVRCNNKLIGARWFDITGRGRLAEGEYTSPRDADGHGSHVAGTAAGNYGVPVILGGQRMGKASGMAPAARIAAYKPFWGQGDARDVDMIAAVDAAVADGVDVINLSASPGPGYDAFSVATFNAEAAGVLFVAAGGNDGSAPGTVSNQLPFTTTVAASTHDRQYARSIRLGDGQVLDGMGYGNAFPRRPLIYGRDAAARGADPVEAARCQPDGRLDPAKVTGKIVICDRGSDFRRDKAQAVADAGGVAMVLANLVEEPTFFDYYAVPTIHLDRQAGGAVKRYAARAQHPVASLTAGRIVSYFSEPRLIYFSGRGPAPLTNGDLLKPDVMAPGVDIIAPWVRNATFPEGWRSDLGTSMATPHVAGVGALVMAKNPRWSPAAVRSALMTTANPRNNEGDPIVDTADGSRANPHGMGAGFIAPPRAFDPGLVYDAGPTQWAEFICGAGLADGCEGVRRIDPSDFNDPSLAVGDLTVPQTLTRTVTNVSGKTSVYTPTVEAPTGVTVTVSPNRLTLAPGASARYHVTLTRTDGAYRSYTFGALTWRDGHGHAVRSAIVVQPVLVAAPPEFEVTGTSGSQHIDLKAAVSGKLAATAHGMVAPTVTDLTLRDDQDPLFDPSNPAPTSRVGTVEVTIPPGAKLARYATFADDYEFADPDMWAFRRGPDGTLTEVAQSLHAGADEHMDLTEPGDYVIFVELFEAGTPDHVQTVHLNQFVVPGASGPTLTVAPLSQQVTVGGSASVTASWSGLAANRRYLGVVGYRLGGAEAGQTVISIR